MAVDEEESGESLYHERQHFQFCLLHCLNNLLQGENSFTRDELDSIADSLATALPGSALPNPLSLIFKPHRNTLTGNYDANVLISALNSRGRETVWFDSRKGIEDLLSQAAGYGDRLLGMVVNFSTKRWLGMWQGRHWVAVRKLQGEWYNLDSDNAAPVCLGDGEDGLREYLDWAAGDDGQLLHEEVVGHVVGAAIWKLQGEWYNLYSDNAALVCLGDGEDGLREYLGSPLQKLQGMWYKLDCDNVAPVCIGDGEDGLREYSRLQVLSSLS